MFKTTTYADAQAAGYRVSPPDHPSKSLKKLCDRLGPEYHLAAIDHGDVIHRVIGDGWDVEIYPIHRGKYNIALWKDHGCQLIHTQEDVPANDVATMVRMVLRQYVPKEVYNSFVHNGNSAEPTAAPAQQEGENNQMSDINKERFYEAVDKPGYWSWLTAERDDAGNILSVSIHSKGEDYHFSDLMAEEQSKALAWLRANISPRKTPNLRHTSYGMKHVLEDRTKIYMTNTQFKELMLLCGYYPVEVNELNWCYCLSNKSPIFKRQKDDKFGLLIPEYVMDYSQLD